jgi:hydrogenase nickel incorporation protein HypA/HybF
MHELSLAQGLVEQALQVAETEGATRVERIVVEIGQHSGVERDALEFAFPFAAEHTLAEGATLDILELPVTVECRQCKSQSHPQALCLLCEQCGSTDVTLKGGREFLIRSIELEIPDS